MAVMVMPMGVHMRPNHLQLGRRAASMGGLAAGRFKLNRRMQNMKALAQSAIDSGQNLTAL